MDDTDAVAAPRWYQRPIVAAVALALVVFFVDIALPVSLTGGDTLWSVPTSYSVVHHGSVSLDDLPNLTARSTVFTGVTDDGHRVMTFPWGPSIVTAPFVAVYDGYLHLRGTNMYEYLNSHFAPSALEIRFASLWVALSAGGLFLLLRRRTRSAPIAALVALVFAFGTSMVSTVSRALWSHAPAIFFLVAALSFLQAFDDRVARGEAKRLATFAFAFGCGLSLGMAYFVRPTSLVPLVIIPVAIALRRWPAAIVAAIAAAIPIATLVAIYETTLGKPLQSYYQFGRAKPSSRFVEALGGDLISPNRGLFVWSPILLLAFVGAYLALRRPTHDWVRSTAVVVVGGYWITIATLNPWWAGWSVGPRLFSDALPFFALLLADGFVVIRDLRSFTWRRVLAVTVAVLAGFSLFVNLRAATHGSVQDWNFKPTSVDDHPNRPWDWSDLQFLR